MIGDTMGIYLFTPLIVIWSSQLPAVPLNQSARKVTAMLLLFLLLCYLNNILDYPLTHFYLLLSIWAAYSFRLHGATLALLAIAFATIIPTTLGIGTFVTTVHSEHRLPILVTFLEITAAVAFMLAALINEREAAVGLLEKQNVELRQSMELHVEAIKEMAKEVLIKQKLTALSTLSSKIANYLHRPLRDIKTSTYIGLKTLQRLQRQLQAHELPPMVVKHCTTLEKNLDALCQLVEEADYAALIIQELMTPSESQRSKTKAMHINTLLSLSLNEALSTAIGEGTPFSYTLSKEFDKEIKTFILLPENLIHVFTRLFACALQSLQHKKQHHGTEFHPELKVRTGNKPDSIEIIICDNGASMSAASAKSLFASFIDLEERQTLKLTNIDFALASDIVTRVYRGTICASAEEGQFFKCTITLPKEL
jgi:signal transduction histidine kinase